MCGGGGKVKFTGHEQDSKKEKSGPCCSEVQEEVLVSGLGYRRCFAFMGL